MDLLKKALFILLSSAFIILILLFFFELLFNVTYQFPKKIDFGVTFSQKYARQLSLDWRELYLKILDELSVKKIRISSYWDEIEKNPTEFDFEELDFMVSEAKKRNVLVILVVGEKQPRWPECHTPSWARNLTKEDRQQKILEFMKKVIQRYNDEQQIWAFQVENEPLLPIFGDCIDKPDTNFLKREVVFVRSLTDKQLIISDSGELGNWILPMQLSDVFGTTLYRVVYNDITGYTYYPLMSYLYNFKSAIVRKLFAPQNLKTIIIELQGEPWSHENNLEKVSLTTQTNKFSPEKFKEYINFAKKTGFDEMYLWGVEWWYWISQRGYPQYWEYAKELFR